MIGDLLAACHLYEVERGVLLDLYDQQYGVIQRIAKLAVELAEAKVFLEVLTARVAEQELVVVDARTIAEAIQKERNSEADETLSGH